MINPEELMIGNYLKCGFDKETLLEVTSISKNGFSAHRVGEENKSLHNEAWDGDPIPITHEELLKLGFEKYDDFWYVLGDIKIEVTTRGYFRFSGYVRIYHLHELQNLFYILTGKQLRYE